MSLFLKLNFPDSQKMKEAGWDEDLSSLLVAAEQMGVSVAKRHQEMPVVPADDDLILNLSVSDAKLSNAANPNFTLEITTKKAEGSLCSLSLNSLSEIIPLLGLGQDDGLYQLLQLRDFDSLKDRLEKQHHNIFSALNTQKKVYIFAALRNGAKCLHYAENAGLEVLGFIDNAPEKQGGQFEGKTILALEDVVDKNIPIIISSGRHGVPIREQLEANGYDNYLSFMSWLFFVNAPYQAESDFYCYLRDMFDHRDEYIKLYLRLADDKSRRVLNQVIALRLTLDAEHARQAADPVNEEYFDPDIIRLGEDEVFIDGGAYDGDTARRFSKVVNGNYRSIYLFEPDQDIFDELKKNAGEMTNAKAINKGLFDKDAVLTFSGTGEMDSAICEGGDIKIEVVALDDTVKEPISFIKLDVEGAEKAALEGASRLIADCKPKMAMGAYHRSHDLWSLAKDIDRLCPGYTYYLRHYSQIIDDTTLYALDIKDMVKLEAMSTCPDRS